MQILALTFAALAFTPHEAATAAALHGRPFPSFVRLQQPPSVIFAAGEAPLPIFLNKNGGHYTCGDDDSARNISTILCSGGSGNLGGFPGTDGEWQQVVDCVAQQFSPFNLEVTDQEPSSGNYIEAVVGGSPGQAGEPNGVAGVSPFICGVIPTSIVYTFADVYQGSPTFVRDVCETTAQEVAHSFGLDHELLCEDPMTYLSGCGAKTFHDQDASCGEFDPRQCSCGGATQNSVQQMLDVLGPRVPDAAPPSVALTSPADGAVLVANSEITVSADASDDAGNPSVVLEWDFTGEEMPCPGSGGAWTCERDGAHHTWHISVGEGARTFRVRVRDFGGNEVSSGDRSIFLSTDGAPPSADDVSPVILVGAPLDEATRAGNAHVQITATVVDDGALASVLLDWPFTGKTFACPSDDGTVSCIVDGSTYTWDLNVGTGDRTWSVKASDGTGHTSTSGPYTLHLVDGALSPVDDAREEDDVVAGAKGIECGAELDLTALDLDWFSLALTSGTRATVTTSPALPLRAFASTDAAGLSAALVEGDGSIDLSASDLADGAALFAVAPAVESGAYHLSIACEDAPSAGGGGDGGGGDDGGGAVDVNGDGVVDDSDASAPTPILTARGGSCAETSPSSTALALLVLVTLLARRSRAAASRPAPQKKVHVALRR